METQTIIINRSQKYSQNILLWLAAFALAMPLTALRQRTFEKAFTVDWQILLRIIPLGFLAFWLFPKALIAIQKSSITSLLSAWLLFIFARIILLLASPSPLYGGMYLYFQLTATIVLLGLSTLLKDTPSWWQSLIIRYLILLIAIAPIVWFINPSSLWWVEYTLHGKLSRYSGALIHPFVATELGAACIGLFFISENRLHRTIWFILGITLCFLSITKTWIASAAIGSLAILWIRKSIPRWLLIICLSVAIFIAAGIDVMVLTRSGSIKEITTLTGRTHLWPIVIDHIYESPLIGFGTGSSRYILPKFTGLTHAHNLWLQILLEGGFVLFLFSVLLSWRFFQTIRQLLKKQDFQKGVLLLYYGIVLTSASVTDIPGIMSYNILMVGWISIAVTHTCPENIRIKIKW